MAGKASRWKRPNERYSKPEQERIERKYREPPGWSHGARVRQP